MLYIFVKNLPIKTPEISICPDVILLCSAPQPLGVTPTSYHPHVFVFQLFFFSFLHFASIAPPTPHHQGSHVINVPRKIPRWIRSRRHRGQANTPGSVWVRWRLRPLSKHQRTDRSEKLHLNLTGRQTGHRRRHQTQIDPRDIGNTVLPTHSERFLVCYHTHTLMNTPASWMIWQASTVLT